MSHSIIPCSGAGIWGKPGGCTGWVMMSQQVPDESDTEDARIGEASHEIGAALIHAATVNPRSAPSCADLVGKPALNGEIYTREMYEAADEYAQNAAQIMRERGIFGGPNMGIEQKVVALRVHELSWGTPDLWIFDPRARELFIWDYKFGHLIVEAFENWQTINYAAGLLEQLGLNGFDEQGVTVRHRICQPRAYHRQGIHREWIVPATDLRAHINILNANAHEALSIDAVCRSGSHCRYCHIRHACEAGLTGGMGLYEATAQPVPLELSPRALGVQLSLVRRARKQLEYLESGYEEQVKSLFRQKVDIPGWMQEAGEGRERWAKPATEVIAMGDMLEKNLRKPQEVITPNQARKLGIDTAVITAYTEKPRTGISVVEDTGSKARRIFSNKP